VGVHIADVSYFLLPDSPLDKIASQRATSIYLVQRVIPMLPRPLCEYLCSLIPNKDRLTFSVVWTLSDKGELLGEWIGRSIIRSKAKLSYDEAQQIIDYPKFHWQKSHFPTIADEQHVPVVVQSVITLNQVRRKYVRMLVLTLL
jgi:DIS3-like exonuclease 2